MSGIPSNSTPRRRFDKKRANNDHRYKNDRSRSISPQSRTIHLRAHSNEGSNQKSQRGKGHVRDETELAKSKPISIATKRAVGADVRGRTRSSSVNAPEDSIIEDPKEQMARLMGFGAFDSTKGKHVRGTKGGTAKAEKNSEYRTYMNRKNGFNRPLSPSNKH